MSYWRQFDYEEIRQMHGYDNQAHEDEPEPDYDRDIEEPEEENTNECPHCSNGCNSCLMLEY